MPTLTPACRAASKMNRDVAISRTHASVGGLNALSSSSDHMQFAEYHATGLTKSGRRGKGAKNKPEFLLASSKFGIDGSSPPLVSSWSYKPIRKRAQNCEGRCPDHRSYSRNSLPEVQSPKWGFTSPAFHCKKTLPRAAQPQLRERSRSQHLPSRARVQNPDMRVQRVSLFSRPHREILATKEERDCRREFNTDSHSCPLSPVNQKPSRRLNRLVILDLKPGRELGPRAAHGCVVPQAWAVSGELLSRGRNSSGQDTSGWEPSEGQNEYSVRKIDIKLPCLPWN